MRKLLLGLVVCSSAFGCASDGSSSEFIDPPLVPSDPLPVTSGSYVSTYLVPSSPELAAAAVYPIDHADWIVSGSTVTLDYHLPVGLVGGVVDVNLSGTIAPGATTIQLSGPQGTGTCVATTTSIRCREEFGNLGQLPISMSIVEQTAAAEYAGPAADRVKLANLFASDPIGIIDIDLERPFVDDHGGKGAD